MGPRDATTVPKLEQAQRVFQGQRERYQKVREDLSVKVKLLEENRVRGVTVGKGSPVRWSRTNGWCLCRSKSSSSSWSCCTEPSPLTASPATPSWSRTCSRRPPSWRAAAWTTRPGWRRADIWRTSGPAPAPGGGGCCVGNETEEGGVSL